jgi:hypothetical protein
MTEQEIIKLAKTNWLAWQGLKELQPEVAAWMEGHKSDIGFLDVASRLRLTGRVPIEEPLYVYRLRPDYEPVRWWFCPTINRTHQQEGNVCSVCMEVTAGYAEYLRNKPDGEWELRIVKVGDTYWSDFLAVCVANTDFSDCDTIGDRGYRWCKPKQPKATHLWREYAITRDDQGYCVWTDAGDRWPLHVLESSPTPLGLFGGVQFKGQKGENWHMETALLITSGGRVENCDCDYNLMPAVPVKCRFREAK